MMGKETLRTKDRIDWYGYLYLAVGRAVPFCNSLHRSGGGGAETGGNKRGLSLLCRNW